MLDNRIIKPPFSKEDSIRKAGLNESGYNRFDRKINLFKLYQVILTMPF